MNIGSLATARDRLVHSASCNSPLASNFEAAFIKACTPKSRTLHKANLYLMQPSVIVLFYLLM